MYLLKNNIIFRNVLVVILLWPILLYSQTNQVQFGKNRVQYHDDFDQWLYYETDLFTVNWYGKSKTAGHKVVRIAEREFNDIIKTIDFKTNEKTEFLVFADITDLKQSNIGISDAFIYDDDITKTIDNKIFIAFDGNHNHLRKQIREGIAAVYLNNILFGSNLQEIVQNSIMLNLPQWYKDGLISYFGEEWSSTYDVKVAKALSKKGIPVSKDLLKKTQDWQDTCFGITSDLTMAKTQSAIWYMSRGLIVILTRDFNMYWVPRMKMSSKTSLIIIKIKVKRSYLNPPKNQYR